VQIEEEETAPRTILFLVRLLVLLGCAFYPRHYTASTNPLHLYDIGLYFFGQKISGEYVTAGAIDGDAEGVESRPPTTTFSSLAGEKACFFWPVSLVALLFTVTINRLINALLRSELA
jgi:hypothetical protein